MNRRNRDDFDQASKNTLSQRVGLHCSNPDCRALTMGPQQDKSKVTNLGVASHITAASAGGPRYDANLSTAQRSSVENGIWLCQTCSKLIDSDVSKYTVSLLNEWKNKAEEAASRELGRQSPASLNDVDLIRFYLQCFDRRAFQDRFMREGSLEAFDKALEDTVTAINTGCLRSRDGGVLKKSEGKSYLKNPLWRQQMDDVVVMLNELRDRYNEATRNGEIFLSEEHDGKQFHEVINPVLADWIDQQRAKIIGEFSKICIEAGIQAPKIVAE